MLLEQKQNTDNEELDKSTDDEKQKVQNVTKEDNHKCPRWYQDFSIDQMKNLMMLQCLMHQDNEERVVGRTQRTLLSIGIMSTFFTLAPDIIKKLQDSSNCNVIDFLREVYKILTGNYFEEEEYKDFYDCNERIILSALAFLTLPETVVELHKRLPPVIMPKLPPKPIPPEPPRRQKMESPYEETLFVRPDWTSYYNNLQYWQQKCQLIPIPKVILPPKDCILTDYKRTEVNSGDEENRSENLVSVSQNNPPDQTKPSPEDQKRNTLINEEQKRNTLISGEQKRNTLISGEQKRNTMISGEQKRNTLISGEQKRNTLISGEQKRNTLMSGEKKKNISISKKARTSDNNPTKDVEENDDIVDEEDEEFNEESIANADSCSKEAAQKSAPLDVPPLYGENRLFDFTINGISEKSGPVEYKLCGTLPPPQPNKKSWLGEKHAHYIISGAPENPPSCPVSYEMTGIANVTPSNSDERFFAVLKLGDGPNKIYPSGRQNLSRHWQEWLQNVDEEFRKVEREANRIVKNIEAITKLVFPDPTCDSCCSCRQSRKSYLKAKETKAPYFVIDTITEDHKKNKYIIGSMAMHSPAPTPPESTVNLLEVIASAEVLTSNVVINGMTNETGKTQYFITGIKEDVIHVPHRIVERPPPPPPRNVPPCVCAIQQLSNKDVTPTLSLDNIPWTKEDGLCFGKKFRPNEAGAYSCKKYPGDKSCRRNPFRRDLMERKRKAERAKEERKDPSKRKMYSIADFQPCGDEHGMGVCGGQWGDVHVLSPEELAEQEKLRKEILKGPPCGTKPGRAVCEGPFGKRISIKQEKKIEIETEIRGEEDEEDEEEDEEEEDEKKKEEPPVKKEREKKRGKHCFASPEAIEARMKIIEEKKVKKFVPDPNYPGYDDPWNVFRTAPTKKESETDFKKLLKLSSPNPPATPVESKTVISESEQPESQKQTSDTTAKKDNLKASVKDSEKLPSGKISKQPAPAKSSSDEKMSKERSKSASKKETETKVKKVSKETLQSNKTDDKMDNRKISKQRKSKNDYRKISTKTMSVKHLKNGNKLNQTGRTSKPIVENTKSKQKQERTSTFDEKSKMNKSMTYSERTSSQRDQFNKKPERTSNYSESTNKSDKKRSQSRQKSTFAVGVNGRKKSIKPGRKKDAQAIHDVDSETFRKNQIQDLKNMLKSPDIYPPDIKPADLPEEPATKCQLDYEYAESVDESVKADEDEDVQLPSKGPCGWKTKSEQELPTKKTLVYLSEPDYPPETIAVRPGGKPCLCRENREKKKILMYNIGGVIDKKKDDKEKKLLKKKKDDDKKMQVIDGVIYYTPPPSPRRSDEYVPEYDVYKSPYDMCVTQRKDKSLKLLERYSRPKPSETSGNQDSCGCNKYIDTYGIQTADENEKAQRTKELDKIREDFVSAKPPMERWKLALSDLGLIDYFTRCRDSIPCWLKCAKFNKKGCPLPYAKLQTKRPVCECRYERKILENDEENMKWKQRQKKLKSMKKQPFVNVANIHKPVVPNTKLMISGVKRIPREDEYIDDVTYCITGVSENYSQLPPKQVVDGVHMSTPVVTPEPSEEKIPCVCLHKHWSAVDVPAGPLPKPEEILLAAKKRRQEAVIEAFKQIYAPQKIYDTHEGHSCSVSCMPDAEEENSDVILQQQQQLNSNKKKNKQDTKHIVTQKTTTKDNRNIENEARKSKNLPNFQNVNVQSQNESTNLNAENDNISGEEIVDHSLDTEDQFMIIAQIELKKMAAEGFLFAKLPKCFSVPQLQYWLMYRRGIALSDADKNDSVHKSILTWNVLDVEKTRRIKPPSLGLTKYQIQHLTFDNANEMKEKIAMKKEIFYSQVRKNRVLYARTMWNTMEYGKFPSTSFKQAYFTYMAGKEADGHVFKPWFPSEVRSGK